MTGALADPTLELHDENGALIQDNDNWKDTQQAEIEATGLQPTDDLESAIFQTLAPGAYTAIVAGKDDLTGVGLVEVPASISYSAADFDRLRQLQFRRERGDDFLEARIAAQRVRIRLQVSGRYKFRSLNPDPRVWPTVG